MPNVPSPFISFEPGIVGLKREEVISETSFTLYYLFVFVGRAGRKCSEPSCPKLQHKGDR